MDELREQIRTTDEQETRLREALWLAQQRSGTLGDGRHPPHDSGGPPGPTPPLQQITSHQTEQVTATCASPPCLPSQEPGFQSSSSTASSKTGGATDPHVPCESTALYTSLAPYQRRQAASTTAAAYTEGASSPSCNLPSCMSQRTEETLSSPVTVLSESSFAQPCRQSPAAEASEGASDRPWSTGGTSGPAVYFPHHFQHRRTTYSTGESHSGNDIPLDVVEFILSYYGPACTSPGDGVALPAEATPSPSWLWSPEKSSAPILSPSEQAEASYSWHLQPMSALAPSASASTLAAGSASSSMPWVGGPQQQPSFRSHEPESNTAFEQRGSVDTTGAIQPGVSGRWSPAYSPPPIHFPPEQERPTYWWHHPSSSSSVGRGSSSASSGPSGPSSTAWPTASQLSQPFFRRHPLDTDSASKQRYPLILGLASQTGERKVER
ncbi:UNVERIFIED_CONTAM: hypothetical protein HHA_454950 [Hammondia hammondi]|eukprot:XP_008888658.1 hypothetical protein HHA_454950 [Hammondia hammondi]